MAVFCVIHELGNSFKDYKPFFKALEGSGVYWRTSNNITFIQSDRTADFIRDILTGYIAKNDKLFVIEVQKHWAGLGYGQNEYDWLNGVL